MIKAREINKFYGSGESRFQVLKNISLTIEDGDFVVILGASGSGKSTLLNVLSGLERAESGQIFYDDTEITGLTDKELTAFRRKKIGFIFQQYYLLQNMNVGKNVKMGGEQQRVSVARALAKRPEVLFLDEPTGALDEDTGRQVLQYISELQKEYGFTIIMVTHNLNIAEMEKTVIRMNNGKVSEVYTTQTQKTAYEIGW